MTGPEHYREAENLAEVAAAVMDYEHSIYSSMSTEERLKRRTAFLAEAQAHATLALAAATALGHEGADGTMPSRDRAEWFAAAASPAPKLSEVAKS